MIRRSGGGGFRRKRYVEEDVSPMDGLGNLADAMLVLAVGMMLAVVMNWNVDLNASPQLQAVDDPTVLSDEQVEEVEDNQALNEMGILYQDPETGQYYIMMEE